MEIVEILNASPGVEKNWVEIFSTSTHHARWLTQVNVMLGEVSQKQIKIILKKFRDAKNFGQFLDKLVELAVAARFAEYHPLFMDESNPGPDIFLEQKEEYIEVKHVHVSDEEKAKLEDMVQNGNYREELRMGSYDSFKHDDSKSLSLLIRKAKEHVDVAIRQLQGFTGLIVMVYSVDFLRLTIEPKDAVAKRFENELEKYSQEKGRRVSFFKLSELLR